MPDDRFFPTLPNLILVIHARTHIAHSVASLVRTAHARKRAHLHRHTKPRSPVLCAACSVMISSMTSHDGRCPSCKNTMLPAEHLQKGGMLDRFSLQVLSCKPDAAWDGGGDSDRVSRELRLFIAKKQREHL